jgi:hypothetical protein
VRQTPWRDEDVNALSSFALFVGAFFGAFTIRLYGWPTLGFLLIFLLGLAIYRWFKAFPLKRKVKPCSCNPDDYMGHHGLTCPLRPPSDRGRST